MSIKVNFYKALLGSVGKILPLRRRPFGKIANSLRVHYARGISKQIDKKVIIEPGAEIMENVVMPPGSSVGPNCLISQGVVFEGNNMMGPNVMIYTSGHKYIEDLHCFNGRTAIEPVYIGQNVWIGYGAIILPGVCIGNNSIIGAGSVVTKSTPPGVVVAGNPAVVKRIIDSEIYQKYLKEQSRS